MSFLRRMVVDLRGGEEEEEGGRMMERAGEVGDGVSVAKEEIGTVVEDGVAGGPDEETLAVGVLDDAVAA